VFCGVSACETGRLAPFRFKVDGIGRWPFIEFAKQLAGYLGRSGGLSAFRTDELESLQKVYQRLKFLDPALLEAACAQAQPAASGTQQRSIAEIVFLLQRLHDERKT